MKSIGFNYLSLFLGLGLFFVSLFYLPNALVGYEVPKVKFLYFMVFGLLLFVVCEVFIKKNIIELGLKEKVVLVWFGLLIVSSVLGGDFLKSWFGNYYRWDGLVTQLVFVTLFLCMRFIDKRIWFGGMLWGLAAGSLMSALIAIGQYFLGKGVGFDGMGAGFGQPVFLAGYLVITLPFTWLSISNLRIEDVYKKWLLVVLLFIVFGGLIATKSLAGVALFFVFIFGLLVIYKKINWKVVMILFFILSGLVLEKYSLEIERGEKLGSGLVYEGRPRLLVKSYLAFLKKPLFGWGVANFDMAFDSVDWPIKINNDIYADKAHSNIVEIIISSGLVGLAGYVYMIFVFFSTGLKRTDREIKYVLFALTLYLIHSQTNVTSVAEEMVFWMALAAI